VVVVVVEVRGVVRLMKVVSRVLGVVMGVDGLHADGALLGST
jgi:hypothetical protein